MNENNEAEGQAQMLRTRGESKYPMTEKQWARLDRDFTYHAPKTDQPERYVAVRESARKVAICIYTTTPPGGEQEHALHYLGLAVFCANAAIARGE